jgi:hypothetical protein
MDTEVRLLAHPVAVEHGLAPRALLRGRRTWHTVWVWRRGTRRVAFPGQIPQSGLGEIPSLL